MRVAWGKIRAADGQLAVNQIKSDREPIDDLASTHPLVLDLHCTLLGHLVQLFDLFIGQGLQIRVLIDLTGSCRLSWKGLVGLDGIGCRLRRRWVGLVRHDLYRSAVCV